MEPKPSTLVNIEWKTLARVIVFALGVWFLWQIADIIAAILFAVVIASAIDPIARWLGRWHIPRLLAVVLVFLLIFSIFFSVAYFILPVMAREAYNFFISFPQHAESFFKNFPELRESLPFIGVENVDELFSDNFAGRFNIESSFSRLLAGIFGGLTSLIIIVVVSFYLAVQDRGVDKFIRLVIPLEYEAYALDLWGRTQQKISYWLQGQVLLMLLVGLLAFLGLGILGVKYAFSLAVLLGVLELIPFAGPVIAAVPAVILGFAENPALGMLVLGLYVIIQQVENH